MNNYSTRFYLTSFFKITAVPGSTYTLQDQQSPSLHEYTVKNITSTTPGVTATINKIYYMGLKENLKDAEGNDVSEAVIISSGPVTVFDTDTHIVKSPIDYVKTYDA